MLFYLSILHCWERLRGEGIVGRGEVPFLAASKEQNSHPNSGVLSSIKSQGWGKFLATRRLVKFIWGFKPSSNYLGGLSDNGHSSSGCPPLDLKIDIVPQCATVEHFYNVDLRLLCGDSGEPVRGKTHCNVSE